MTSDKKIDRNSIIPFYHQMKSILKEKIKNKEFEANDFLPSENKLAKKYNISRNTVRRALKELMNEGLIKSSKGKGYYVTEPKLEQNLFRFYSFAKDFSKGTNEVVSKLLCREVMQAPKYVAEKLNISKKSRVHKIVRNRFFNDEPLIYETSYVSAEKFSLLDIEDNRFQHGCIYDILQDTYDINIGNGEEFLEPINLSKYEADRLNVKNGSPALLIESLIYDINNNPIELRESIARGDKLRFKLDFNV